MLKTMFLYCLPSILLLLEVTTSQDYNDSIRCGVYDDEADSINVTITYTKLPFTIKKDNNPIMICTKHNCSFYSAFKNDLFCYCDLGDTNQTIILKALKSGSSFTPKGLWSINTEEKDISKTTKISCLLDIYVKAKNITCNYEDNCTSISVKCNIGTIYPEAVCSFEISNSEALHANVQYNHTTRYGAVPYYSTECYANITKTAVLKDHTNCSLTVVVFPNITDFGGGETSIKDKNTVHFHISDIPCNCGLTQSEILVSTDKVLTTFNKNNKTNSESPNKLTSYTDDDHIIHYTISIALAIVCSFLTLFLVVQCFKRILRVQVTLKDKIISSKCHIQTEDLDNSEIYSFNILQSTIQQDIPVNLTDRTDFEYKMFNNNRDTLGSLSDDYCTIDRLSICKRLATSKQSTRTTSDFDPYSTIEECLLDKEIDTPLAYEFGNHENDITSIIKISEKSKDGAPTKLVSKRHRDGNIYESIA